MPSCFIYPSKALTGNTLESRAPSLTAILLNTSLTCSTRNAPFTSCLLASISTGTPSTASLVIIFSAKWVMINRLASLCYSILSYQTYLDTLLIALDLLNPPQKLSHDTLSSISPISIANPSVLPNPRNWFSMIWYPPFQLVENNR